MSMEGIVKIATKLKERDNKEYFSISTAKIINKNPFVLKLSERIFLSKEYENLALSETLYNKINTLNIDDEIIVIPITEGSLWYALDKVVNL